MDSALQVFLKSEYGATTSAAERMLLNTRVPLQHRTPSVALYQGLLLYHRGMLTLAELEPAIDLNEELDRSIEAKGGREVLLSQMRTPKPLLRLVERDDDRSE